MKRALFVGINDYQWPGGQLTGCANDAISLATVLSENYDETANFQCKVLVSDQEHEHTEAKHQFSDFENSERITQGSLKRSVADLFKGECDIALFYFSGHGHGDDLGGKLVTSDALQWNEGVPVSDILLMANQANQIREIFIILDCCYSGTMGNIPVLNENQSMLRQGISILTASRAQEVSREKDGLGVFTRILINGLDGGAADVTGNVTSASLYSYADGFLGAFEQRPVYKAHITWLRPLRQAKPMVSIKEMRMLTRFFETDESEFALDPSFEPEAQPHHQENEAKFAILQRYRSASLIEPINEKHLYYEAMNSGGCRLTMTGKLYWKKVKNNKI